MKSKTPVLLVLTTSLLAGCASLQPKAGVAPTGEPLRIDTWTSSRSETVSEKVGESDHYSADGSYLGTSEQYQDRTVTHSEFHWQPMQGRTAISDADYYRILGDTARAEHARRYRRNGAIMAVVGGVGLLAGTAVAISAPLLGDRISDGQALGMYVGGGLLAAGGGLGFAYGFKRLRIDGHPYGYGEALDVLEDRGPVPPPPVALGARPRGRTVMLPVLSRRF